jgi:nondiscriminating aspartyl-tRNA synthetase
MKRTLVLEALKSIGQEIKAAGWVQIKRDHGKMVFIDLWDRTGILQVVGNKELADLRPQDVVEITGLVKQRPAAMVNKKLATGEIELEAKEVKVLASANELPFDMGADDLRVELPTLLDWRALSLRHPKARAIFRVQETIVQAFREVLKIDGFTEIQAPTIVPTITEGGAEVFKVKYFDKDAFLGQSPQLYKQIMVGVFERVFTLAHAYRAEPSVTARHLTEYLGLDAEMGFIESFQDIMDEAERVVRYIFQKLNKERSEELKLFGAATPKLPAKIPCSKMREAQKIIFERTGRDNRQEPDLEPEDEKEICRYAFEKYGSELIFITHYPTKKRPFYTYPDPKDPEYTCSFDLLGRGLEWVTGGQRINDYQTLLEHVKKWGNKPADFELYLQAFKFGMPQEGGFCLGAERITMQILGLTNIREASFFPRDMERIDQRLATIKPKSLVAKAKKIKNKLK